LALRKVIEKSMQGSEYTVGFVPKLKFEIVISNDRVHKAVKVLWKQPEPGKSAMVKCLS
jgi:nitrogen regulatory protein PII